MTEGLPVAGVAWNHQNPDLLAAGYGAKPLQPSKPGTSSGEATAAGGGGVAGGGRSQTGAGAAAAGGEGGNMGTGAATGGQQQQQQQRSKGGDGGAMGGTAAAAAAPGVGGPGRVALWSLKNPNYPLWSFSTDAGGFHSVCWLRQATRR